MYVCVCVCVCVFVGMHMYVVMPTSQALQGAMSKITTN